MFGLNKKGKAGLSSNVFSASEKTEEHLVYLPRKLKLASYLPRGRMLFEIRSDMSGAR